MVRRMIPKVREYYATHGAMNLFVEGTRVCGKKAVRRIAPWSRVISTAYNNLSVYNRSDIRVYADNLLSYGNAEAIEIKAPPCNTQIPPEISHIFGPHHFEQPFVAEFTDGYIHETGVSLDSDGTILLDAIGSRRDQFEEAFRNRPLELLQIAKEQREGLPTADRTLEAVSPCINAPQFERKEPSGGFAGFVRSTLAIIEALEYYEQQTGITPKILVPTNYRNRKIEAFCYLGWNRDDIVRWKPGERIRVQRLVIPSSRQYEQLKPYHWMKRNGKFNRWYKSVSPSALHWTRKRVRDRVSNQYQSAFPEHIYISRNDASKRQVINEDELVDQLRGYGFESFELTNLSMVDQIILFSQADTVIGPHGAGLGNTVFCSDCTVIELAGVKNKPTFLMQAQKLDLDYRLVIGKKVKIIRI